MSLISRLSIGANLVLLGIVALLWWRHPAAAPARVAPPATPGFVRGERSKPRAAFPDLPPMPAGPKNTPAAMAQLEQMGISHEILVNVLLEDHSRRSARRLLELQRQYAPRLVPDSEVRELTRQSDAEQVRELKEAFGEEGYLAWDKQQTLRSLNRARVPGDELAMTPAEADQAYRLQKAFDEEYKGLQEAMESGVADKAEAGALQAQAQQALDRELEKLLGKPRFDELRGNTDPTTEVYRTYGELNPTSDQAEAVVLAQGEYSAREAALAERVMKNPGDAANVSAELKAISEAHDENLRQIFGAEAYDSIKLQNDPTYKTLQQYAQTWGLNDAEVQSVYATLRPLQDQADRMRIAAQMSEAAGQPVNWQQINSTLAQAQQQAEAGLQNLIGGQRVRRLKQNGLLTSQ